MTDLEWYLEIGGKQSGPHAAKEIVDLVRAGRIPANAQVTAARMSGDWVAAKDLVDAYDELYKKSSIPQPVQADSTLILNKTAPVMSAEGNFKAPPRPTEQLEATKSIIINRAELDNTPDPTEALFQAIQAVREKSSTKNSASTATLPTSSTAQKNDYSPSNRSSRVPSQLVLIITLAAIFGGTIYGIMQLLGNKKTEGEMKKPPARVEMSKRDTQAPSEASASKQLLGSDESGTASPRKPGSPITPMRPSVKMPSRGANSRIEKGGGARYRDERDQIDEEVDEVDEQPANMQPHLPGGDTGGTPVDPSQVPLDRVIPESIQNMTTPTEGASNE